MHPYTYSVSLRVWHPSTDPARITHQLGIEPTRCWKAGDARSTPKRTLLEGVNRETYWTASLTSDGEESSEGYTLADFLALSIKKLGGNQIFLASLRFEGGRAEFFVGLYGTRNFGMELPPALLAAIAEVGLALSLDIYPE